MLDGRDVFAYLLFAKDYRIMTSGRQGAPVCQEIRPGAGFKSSDVAIEKSARVLP